MINLRFLLGLYPSTEKCEHTWNTLWAENERLKQIPETAEFKEMMELKDIVLTDAFKARRLAIETEKYKGSPEQEKEKAFLQLKKSKTVKKYLNTGEIAEGDQEIIDQYNELNSYICSSEFIDRKNYLNLPKAEKFKRSEEYTQLTRYQELIKTPDIVFFTKNNGHKRYDAVKPWKYAFEDDFKSSLDKKTWITKYFWGNALLKDTYALTEDKFICLEKNLSVAESKLKITAHKEKVKGKAWDPKYGIFEKDFEYTAGTVNTGASFKQAYGRFEAKIKFSTPGGITHGFWLVGDKQAPLIDVARCGKKITFTNLWDNNQRKTTKLLAGAFLNKYLIYTLDWTPGKLEWKINGVTMAISTEGVPNEPLFINFSSGVYGDKIQGSGTMEIDWVRCLTNNN